MKSIEHFIDLEKVPSLPTWERGLKYCVREKEREKEGVAPYMGAWIEIVKLLLDLLELQVAPYMGAWIEILGAFHFS